jgi:predicted adenine nucleotide alpha hydrolase (AANH) superfamily ATPase
MKDSALLHVCCAPDATVPWPALREEGFEVDGFFYGSNIHPEDEWARRRDAVKKLAAALGERPVIFPYDPESWLGLTRNTAREPEGGARCRICFRAQLKASAEYAASMGYKHLCTTLSISPHKDPLAINMIGSSVADSFGVKWLERVWRKKDGFKMSVSRSRELGLYRQNYCGCVYSSRQIGREEGFL